MHVVVFSPLFACILGTLAGVAAKKVTYPATLELDVVFPRENGTYAPQSYFPIVFGLQNATAGWPLGLYVAWSVQPYNSLFPSLTPKRDNSTSSNNSSGNTPFQSFPGLPTGGAEGASSPPSDPYFFIGSANLATNETVQDWTLQWRFEVSRNCSADGSTYDSNTTTTTEGSVSFKTTNGGEMPDVVSGWCSGPSSPSSPSNTSSDLWRWGYSTALAFGIRSVANATGEEGSGTCAVLEDPAPTPDPCALQVGGAVAASVSSAMMAATSCTTGAWPGITAPCTTQKTSSAADGTMQLGPVVVCGMVAAMLGCVLILM